MNSKRNLISQALLLHLNPIIILTYIHNLCESPEEHPPRWSFVVIIVKFEITVRTSLCHGLWEGWGSGRTRSVEVVVKGRPKDERRARPTMNMYGDGTHGSFVHVHFQDSTLKGSPPFVL